MRLILKVLSYKGLPFPSEMRVEFDWQGGIIGRHAGNTMVLEDMDKIVSGRHAEIVYENEQFQIKDTSTNGTYLLNAGLNLNNTQTVLQNNEILRIGEYEILAEIISDFSPANELNFDNLISPSFSGPFDSGPGSPIPIDPFSIDHSPFHDSFSVPAVVPEQNPPKEIADFLKGLDSLPPLSSGAVFSDTAAESEAIFTSAQEPLPDVFATARQDIQDPFKQTADSSPALSSVQPVQDRKDLAPAASMNAAGQGSQFDSRLMQHFLEGAGIKDENFLMPEQWAGVMNTAGTLFRSMVEGLMDVLRARAEMKSEFRVSVTTIRSSNNNPLKFNPDVEHVLKLMIGPPNPAFIDANDAVNEAFRDIKYHQIAMTAGIQASVAEILDRFEPGNIEKVYAEGMVFQKKAKCWDLFCEKYPEYKAQSMEDFFGEAFASAYEKQMRLFGRP